MLTRGGTVRLGDRALLLPLAAAGAAATAATAVQDPVRSAAGGEKERAGQRLGESARLAVARAGGRPARAGRERKGEGVGRGGRGRREGGPLEERGSARACVLSSARR